MKLTFSLKKTTTVLSSAAAVKTAAKLLGAGDDEKAGSSEETLRSVQLCASGEFDWQAMAASTKRRRLNSDVEAGAAVTFERLKARGDALAVDGKYMDAIDCWEQALCLKPDTAELHEMIAQAYLELDLPLEAIHSAQTAVRLSPTWFVAKQTLGRSQLNVGDVRLALKTFCKAAHMAPFDEELRSVDLIPAWNLLKKALASMTQTDKKDDAAAGQDGGGDMLSSKYFGEGSVVVPQGYTVLRLTLPSDSSSNVK